jgi:hypothetical protein
MTINGFAALCVAGGEPPEEENDPAWGCCPLLDGGLCSVYPLRPFACRCLLSETVCSSVRPALVPPFILTVNTVFLQVIENLDAGGLTGNLSDLVPALARGLFPPLPEAEKGLVRNRKADRLLVPPEHAGRIRPVLTAMSRACQGVG